MNHCLAPLRLAVTGRLLLPVGKHWLVEVVRPGASRGASAETLRRASAQGDPDLTIPTFHWQFADEPAHTATCVRPFGDDLALREIELQVFGPLVDDSWLPVLS